MRIIISLTLVLAVSLCSQSTLADVALRKKISDAATICSGDGIITKANAPAVITRCNNALVTMLAFHAPSQSDNFDKNWFNFNGGAVLILLAGAYTINNDNKLNKNACQNALNADRMWSNIKAAPGSKLASDITNDALFNKLVPPCKKAFKPK